MTNITTLSSKDQAVNSKNCTSNTPNLLKPVTEQLRTYIASSSNSSRYPVKPIVGSPKSYAIPLDEIFYSLILTKRGNPDYLGIKVISYLADRYCPIKFEGNLWQTSYAYLEKVLGAHPDTIKRKLIKLEKLGLAKRVFELQVRDGNIYNNVLHIWLNTQLIDELIDRSNKGETINSANYLNNDSQLSIPPSVQKLSVYNNLINNITRVKKEREELRFCDLLKDDLITQISNHLKHPEEELRVIVEDLATKYPNKTFSTINGICNYLAKVIETRKEKIPKDFSFYLKNLTNEQVTEINSIVQGNYSYKQIAEIIQNLINKGNKRMFEAESQFISYLVSVIRTQEKDKTFLDFLNTKACKELNLDEHKLNYLMKRRTKPKFKDGDEDAFRNYILTLPKTFFNKVAPITIYKLIETTKRKIDIFNRGRSQKLSFDALWPLIISQMKQGLNFYEIEVFRNYLDNLLYNDPQSIKQLEQESDIIIKSLTTIELGYYYCLSGKSKQQLDKIRHRTITETSLWASKNDAQVKNMYQYYCSTLSSKQLQLEQQKYLAKNNQPFTTGFLKFIRKYWTNSPYNQQQNTSRLLPKLTENQTNYIKKLCSSFHQEVTNNYFFKTYVNYKLEHGIYPYNP